MRRLAEAVLSNAVKDLRVNHRRLIAMTRAMEAVLVGTATWSQRNRIHIAYSRWRIAREFFVRGSAISTLGLYCGIVGRAPDRVRDKVEPLMNLPWSGPSIRAALDRYGRRAVGRPRRYNPAVIDQIKLLRSEGHSWAEIAIALERHESSLRKALRKYA